MPAARSRTTKQAALAKLKAAKERRLQGGTGTASLDDAAVGGGGGGGGGDNDNDDNDDNAENDDLYDHIPEEEYQQLVKDRREREDFVVDDDGLGYYDDGEEHYGDEDNHDNDSSNNNKKKRSSSAHATTATLTQQALKKARKQTAHASSSTSTSAGAAAAAAAVNNNKSMWDFVNRGGTASAAEVTGAATSSAKSRRHTTTMSNNKSNNSNNNNNSNTMSNVSTATDVDALLEQLDDPMTAVSSSSRNNSNSRARGGRNSVGRGSASRLSGGTGRSRGRSRAPAPAAAPAAGRGNSSRNNRARASRPLAEDDNDDNDFPSAFDDDDNDNDNDNDNSNDNAMAMDAVDEINKNSSTSSPAAAAADGTKRVHFSDNNNNNDDNDGDGDEAPQDPVADVAAAPDQEVDQEHKPQSRRRLARPKLGQLSAPAQKALDKTAATAVQNSIQNANTSNTSNNSNKNTNANTALPLVDATSASFQPAHIATEVNTGPTASTAGQLDLVDFLVVPAPAPAPTSTAETDQVDQETPMTEAGDDDTTTTTTTTTTATTPKTKTPSTEPYLDMFWTDLSEKNGTIFLFGKVAVPNNNTAPSATTPVAANTASTVHTKFVSACAIVTGNVRNLFVLPRQPGDNGGGNDGNDGNDGDGDGDNDATPSTMMEVHQEINNLLHNGNIIPRVAGASWAGKVVKRKYAFEDPQVPREETDYLKVVYDSKYPVPSEEVCLSGGQHFSKILGGGASNIENFIVKRKLMGPCWVRIRAPVASNAPLSWCKLEFKVDDPKNLTRLDLEEQGALRPPPPVVTMSIKLKTVVNAKTHKAEIVSISALCHKHVMLETASDESPKHMTQLSLIRPLAGEGSGAASGLPQFPRDIDAEIANCMPQLRREPNERAMLSRLFAQIGQWDPDVIVGHNAWGWDMEVLLTRCIELKVNAWSKIGRRRRSELPSRTYFSSRKDMAIADACAGRLLCDTYLTAKELLRETTYSLTNLAATQLKMNRQEIEPVDIPQWFNSSKTIVQLALSTSFDVQLVQRLMFKLQILPLSKQLTCIAGNIWSHTLKSNRAERTEYLLLHEFRRLKFLAPEKRRPGKRTDKSGKAKFSGGLVLEPKKGLYDSFILLLDFNSLYPSIIQEYNLCFTTIEWSKFAGEKAAVEGEEAPVASSDNLPPLPDEKLERGVLPRVIKSLVERRRAVKKILKNEQNPEKREELDIRQKALKLTANSMYGCLGFSNSRFYAQPIAAMVTAMGRETLQRTVDIAQNSVGLDVIYGDTDSIMINTRLNDENDLARVYELGEQVKREVNRLYRSLELEIDGVFRSMLLLKKKKYAAKTVERLPDGSVKYGQELKGLDLVRRDWCIQSKDTGRYVTDQILSGEDSEIVVQNIYTHLEELATKMRNEELPLEKYVITKGLSKHPNDYPDGKSQPHVQVAKTMIKNNRNVNTGDYIPYIITAPVVEEGSDKPKATTSTERARHPEEIARSGGVLKPDIEWYLAQQILPPIGRLCEPIEGTSQSVLAAKLGLDTARYNQSDRQINGIDDDDLIDYVPASFLPDQERFKDVEKLKLFCLACGVEGEFPGVFHTEKDIVAGSQTLVSGLQCTNPECHRPMFWGQANHFECYARIANTISIWVRGVKCKYYEGLIRCDEASCGLETRQLSVAGGVCLRRGCNGRMMSVESERDVHTHLKYLETLFDADHACDQLEKKKQFGRKTEVANMISKHDKTTFDELHLSAGKALEASAFNWISPSFWKGLFNVGAKQ